MKKLPFLLLFAAVIISLQSCFIFGLRTHLKWKDEKGVAKLYKRYHIAHEHELYLDTGFSIQLAHIYKGKKDLYHDHCQPVQYLLFDKQGYMKSFMINCYVDANFLFYPRWNKKHYFDSYPTKTMRPTDSLLTLQKLLPYIKDLVTDSALQDDTRQYDYTEFVFFSQCMYRVSKGLIKAVKHQDKKGFKVKTYYVYGDYNFIWDNLDTAKKQKVREEMKAQSTSK